MTGGTKVNKHGNSDGRTETRLGQTGHNIRT